MNPPRALVQPDDGTPAPPERWQQRNTAATRKLILDAATDCLVEGGYARLTTVEVLKQANVSRGAMHHHFASRADLVSALIDHVLHKRLDRFLSDYLAALRDSDPENAIEVATGRVAASLIWPTGNQIFAIEALPAALADGLPFRIPRGTTPSAAERTLFYAWRH